MGDSKALEAAYADALEHEKIWATKRETLMEQLVVHDAKATPPRANPAR